MHIRLLLCQLLVEARFQKTQKSVSFAGAFGGCLIKAKGELPHPFAMMTGLFFEIFRNFEVMEYVGNVVVLFEHIHDL